jgi:hypothetical protein
MPWLNLAMAPLLFVVLALVAIATGTEAFADPVRWRMAGWKTEFGKATVPLGEIASGGPPRDGIPPIDQPLFKSASEVKDLPGREPVMVYPLTAEARAYPLRILMWHEIVNDTVAGIPVAVTYCTLCNAALVFDRRVAGRTSTLGPAACCATPTWSCGIDRPRAGGSNSPVRRSSATMQALHSNCCRRESRPMTSS